LLFSLIYFGIGTLTPNTFLDSLYHSAISYTAIGYGNWSPGPTGQLKGLGAFESVAGVSMMALHLATFVGNGQDKGESKRGFVSLMIPLGHPFASGGNKLLPWQKGNLRGFLNGTTGINRANML
jgi:hypothetical protein